MKKRLSITILLFFLLIIFVIMGIKTSLLANFNPNKIDLFYEQKVPISSVRTIVEDGKGNIYIGQNYNKCIQKFDSNGNHKITMGFFAKSVEFYVDDKTLLHVFYYEFSDLKEQIIDTSKKKVLSERILNDDEDEKEIIDSYNSNKKYSIKNNVVHIQEGKKQRDIDLKDMPKKQMQGIYYFIGAFICFIAVIRINKKDLASLHINK